MKILLTGKIGVGKSTIIEKSICNKNIKIQGFLTYKGPFLNSSYDTYIRNINEKKIYNKDYRIVKRQTEIVFYPETFDKIGMEILNEIKFSNEYLTIFDEIGVIESKSLFLKDKLLEILASPINFIGVLKEKDNPFLNEIKEKKYIELIHVTQENREEVYKKINKMVERFEDEN